MLVEQLIGSIETEDEKLFGELADKIKEVRTEYVKLSSQAAESASTIRRMASELETAKLSQQAPKKYIEDMEKTIVDLQSKLRAKLSSEIQMPIINSDAKFIDTNVIVLREIKTAIYLNKLMEFILNTYRLHQKAHQRKCMLLVLDPMSDELRVKKYQKHSYPINELVKDVPMLITNKDSKSLTGLIDFSIYDEVTIIDRYQRMQSAVNHSKADIYYLVDSYSDVVDYNLSRTQCLAFVNKGEDRFVNTIDPATDISGYSAEEKPGIIATCPFIERTYCYEV